VKSKNVFQKNEKVRIKSTGETVTISNYSYVAIMKRYSYTVKENPQTFYFQEEIEQID
jgi:uncharacterized protein YodC (DUF2158 family)